MTHWLTRNLATLARRPMWTASAVLTLGLAIGAATAVFSVINTVVLRPQPFPQPDGVITIFRAQPPITRGPISSAGFLELAAANDRDLTIAGLAFEGYAVTGGEGAAERITGARVTADYFGVFRMQPALGRWLGPADHAAGAEDAVVISHALWQRRFGGAPSAIGAGIALNGRRYTVVGVAPAEFNHPLGRDAWVPLLLDPAAANRGNNWISLVARRADGLPLAQVQARLDAVSARWRRDFPQNHTGLALEARTLHEVRVGGVRSGLYLLFGAVGLVLLIACANVANMQLARVLGRQRELATRLALGAGTMRIVGEALAESLLLAGLGCLLGTAFAWAGIQLLVAMAPAGLPRIEQVGIDGATLAVAWAMALGTGLLAGLMPAMVARATAISDALRSGGKQAGGGARQHWRRGLVAGELALSVVLLVGAGLLTTSLAKLSAVDPGFRTDHLLTGMVAQPQLRLVGDAATEAERQAQYAANDRFLRQVRERLMALPGVVSVGAIDSLPVSGDGNWNGGVQVGGREPFPPGEEPVVEFRFVHPGYFETLGLTLRRGETLRDDMPLTGPFPIVVNDALVQRLFPDRDPIGQTIQAIDGQAHPIIGVVSSARQWGLDRDADPELYIATAHLSGTTDTTLVIRTAVAPGELAEPVRRAIAEVDPDVPFFAVRTMEEVLEQSLAQRRFAMTLLLAFALAAVVIAAVGLYGVMSYSIALSTHDIGVRMALGARRGEVLFGTLRDGLSTAALGVALGLGAAAAASGLLASLVYGVSPTTPAIYLASAFALLVVAALACLVPALRASRIEPMEALRYE